MKVEIKNIYSIIFGEYQEMPEKMLEIMPGEVGVDRFRSQKLKKISPITIEQLKEFASNYPINEKLGKLLIGENFKSQDFSEFDKKVKDNFDKICLEHNFKFEDKDFQQYLVCYKTSLITASLIENNNNGEEISTRAFNMFLLFGDDLQAAQQVLNGEYGESSTPFHDMLMGAIPNFKVNNEELDIDGWRKLVKSTKGVKKVVKAFSQAHELQKDSKAPSNMDEFVSNQEGILNQSYGKLKDHPEFKDFAAICKHYKISEYLFDKCLKLIEDRKVAPKVSDEIPDIVIDIGKEFPEFKDDPEIKNKDGFYLVRLPAGDLRGLILGEITDCCQSVGGNSEFVSIDGTNLQTNGFYVLIKSKGKDFNPHKIDWDNFEKDGHKIQGQGYVWLSHSKSTLTIDSWENLSSSSNNKMMGEVLKKFGEKIHSDNPSIQRVTIGIGGKTPEEIRSFTSATSEGMFEGKQYGDSKNQVELYVDPDLLNKIEQLEKELDLPSSILQEVLLSSVQIEEIRKLKEDGLLEDIAKDRIPLFLTPILMRAYRENKLDIIDLKALSNDHFDLLTMESFLECYINEKVTLTDLMHLTEKSEDINFLKKLFNNKDVVISYINEIFTIEDFKDISEDLIYCLMNPEALEIYKSTDIKPSDFKDTPEDLIYYLTRPEALEIYKSTNIRPIDFKYIPKNLVYCLMKPEALEIFQSTDIKPIDFKDIPQSLIYHLTNPKALEIYKSTNFKPYDFKHAPLGFVCTAPS